MLYADFEGSENLTNLQEMTVGRAIASDGSPCWVKSLEFNQSLTWDGVEKLENEAQLLQRLDHRGIPKHLRSGQSEQGFYWVQEFLPGCPLSRLKQKLEVKEIKAIATQLLEIVDYLQSCDVVHGNICPDKVLLDESGSNIRVFLVGFEESRRDKQKAIDLKGVGLTLVALASDLSYLGETHQLEDLLPSYSQPFIEWLGRLITPQPGRVWTAREASIVLNSLDLVVLPQLVINQRTLNFQLRYRQEKICGSLVIENIVPKTMLQGEVFIAGNSFGDEEQIVIANPSFVGNEVKIDFSINTCSLMPMKNYEWPLLISSNAVNSLECVFVSVSTEGLVEKQMQPVGLIVAVYLAFGIFGITSLYLINLKIGLWLLLLPAAVIWVRSFYVPSSGKILKTEEELTQETSNFMGFIGAIVIFFSGLVGLLSPLLWLKGIVGLMLVASMIGGLVLGVVIGTLLSPLVAIFLSLLWMFVGSLFEIKISFFKGFLAIALDLRQLSLNAIAQFRRNGYSPIHAILVLSATAIAALSVSFGLYYLTGLWVVALLAIEFKRFSDQRKSRQPKGLRSEVDKPNKTNKL